MLANDTTEEKRQGGFFLLVDTRPTVAELMAECPKCGAMTANALELAWRLGVVVCTECHTSMELGKEVLMRLRAKLIESRIWVDRLIDAEVPLSM